MSFLFGSTSNLPAQGQKPLGLNAERTTTNESARPVPYLAGRNRLGATVISRAFNRKVVPVTQQTGKDSSSVAGYRYYCSFALLLCHGPVKSLSDQFLNGDSSYLSAVEIACASLSYNSETKLAKFVATRDHELADHAPVQISGVHDQTYNLSVEINVDPTKPREFTYALREKPKDLNPKAETGFSITAQAKLAPIQRDNFHPVYVDLVIPEHGNMRLYWGTEAQQPDEYLNSSGVQHPAYAGFCYAVFKDWYIGFNQTNLQNFDHILARYASGIKPELAPVKDDVNPVEFIVDLLRNPRAGHGLPESLFDLDALQTAAKRLRDEGIGFSPVLSRAQQTGQTLVQACEYFDGFPLICPDGRFKIVLNRTDSTEDKNLLYTDSLAARPQFSPEDWSEAATMVRVKFTNRTFAYKEDMLSYPNAGTAAITGQDNVLTLDRAWATSSDMAARLSLYGGRAAAVPKLSGTLKLRRWRRATLNDPHEIFDAQPGDALFLADYNERLVAGKKFRVVSRTVSNPSRPEISLEIVEDRSYLYPPPDPESPPPALRRAGSAAPESVPSQVSAKPYVAPAVAVRIVELPLALCDAGKPSVAVLVARPDERASGYSVLLARNYDWDGTRPDTYEPLLKVGHCAQAGTLTADYPANTCAVDLKRGLRVSLFGPDLLLEEQNAFTALTDQLLVFAGREVMSVAGAELLGEGYYLLRLVRGRFATPIEDHHAGDTVFIQPRATLPVVSHPHLQFGNTLRLKIVMQSGDAFNDAGQVDPHELIMTGFMYSQLGVANLRVNGQLRNPCYRSGEGVSVAWTPLNLGTSYAADDFIYHRTKLELFDETNTKKGEKIVSRNPASLSHAELTAMHLTGNFLIRARTITRRSEFSLESPATPQLKVFLI